MEDDILCPACRGRSFHGNVGRCVCGGYTAHTEYTHCLDCAKKKRICQACGTPTDYTPRISGR